MVKNKPLIKICGVTSIKQAIEIAKLGADAIGVISVEESPRFISSKKKNEIFKALKDAYPNIQRVTVVKNSSIEKIKENFIENPNEGTIQLHGDEDIEYCQFLKQKIPNICLWKAFRIKSKKDIEDIKPYENFIDAIILDSWNNETYGGSGKRIKSEYLKNLNFSKPWWLAGGISISWIDKIMKDIKPNGIDISSSVEISAGIKDIKKIKEIINELKNNIF